MAVVVRRAHENASFEICRLRRAPSISRPVRDGFIGTELSDGAKCAGWKELSGGRLLSRFGPGSLSVGRWNRPYENACPVEPDLQEGLAGAKGRWATR